jgi:hypothetical protein
MNQPPAAGDALAPAASPGAPVPPDRDALRVQLGDPIAEAREEREERHRILDPMLAGVQQSAADYQRAGANSPKPPSPGPEPQRGMGMQAAGNWIMFASALGMLAGGLTKRHSMNAMAAFSGALEGVQQGNKEAFEQNKTIWEEENKRAAQAYQQQRDAYNDIINNKKMDLQTRMLVFEQTAKMLGDDAVATAAARRDERLINEVILKQNDAYERAKQEYLKLEGKTLQEGIKAGIAGPEDVSKFMQKIGGSPLTGGGGGGLTSEGSIEAKYGQLKQGYNFNELVRGMTRPDIARFNNRIAEGVRSGDLDWEAVQQARANYAGDIAGGKSVGNRLANLESVNTQLVALVPQAIAASKAVGRVGIMSVDEALQWAEKQVGYPPLKYFIMTNIQLAEQQARALKGPGVLDKGIQDLVFHQLTTAQNDGSYETALKAIVDGVAREKEGLLRQRRREQQPVPEIPGAYTPPGLGAGAEGGRMSDDELKKKLGL